MTGDERAAAPRGRVANLLKRLLPFVGGIALIVLLLRQIHPQDVVDLLLGANPWWLAVGALWYCVTSLLRAYRFGLMLRTPGTGPAVTMLPEMFALSFLNNVLPSRAGELSFPYFRYRRAQIPVSRSTTVLVVARIFDYVAVSVLYVLFTWSELSNLNANAARVVGAVGVLLALTLVVLALSPWLAQTAVRLARGILRRLGRGDSRLDGWVEQGGQGVIATLNQMRNPRTYFFTFLWSVAIWLATFAWFASYMAAIGLPQRYSLVVVGSTFASLAKALPFVTIGGFGAHEAGWTIGFSLTGMETAQAIASGFAVNILTLITSLLFGGPSLLFLNGRLRAEHSWQQLLGGRAVQDLHDPKP